MLCKKILTIVLVLLSWNSYSNSNTTALGVEEIGGSHSLVSTHNLIFDHEPFNRLGHAHIRLRVGNRSGVHIRTNGGFPALWTGDFINSRTGFFFSIDSNATHVNWTHGDERDFYNLMPGGALGLFSRMGSLSIDASVKTGASITNFYSHKFLQPDTYKYHGFQASVFLYPKIGFSYDKYFVQDIDSQAFNLHFKMSETEEIIYRQEQDSYGSIDKRNILMFNLEF